jgi:hypothetical protein
MPNLSEIHQRRQLPGAGDRPGLYPYRLSETACLVCSSTLEPKPVPGAIHFPRRLECPQHGYVTPEQLRNNKCAVSETEDWREGLKDIPSYAYEDGEK